ncbi:MAG: hypothetical protein BGO31_16065 [Bacteroidetes bacterium 43-16]|nr:MAG: hypothetical protein BGO31_16065 [Bacteroidetes bacterium 43-16]
MKKITTLALGVAFAAVSCQKVDGESTDKKAGEILQQKNWRMTGYYDDGNDRLVSFTGYSFTFNNDGTVHAIRDGVVFNGSWKDTMYTDTVGSTASLKLQFDNTRPFNGLNKNWMVIEKTTKTLHLRYQDFPKGPYDDVFLRINY